MLAFFLSYLFLKQELTRNENFIETNIGSLNSCSPYNIHRHFEFYLLS